MQQRQSIEVDAGTATNVEMQQSQTTKSEIDVQDAIDSHREVFVLIGLPGSGKSTAAEIIEEEHDEAVEVHSVSEYVRDSYRGEPNAAEYGGLEPSDNSLGEWAAEKKAEHGNDYFVRALAEEIKSPSTPHVVIDGVRSPAEAVAIENVFEQASVYTLAIWTLPDIRFERKYGTTPCIEHDHWETFTERNERELWDWGAIEFFARDSSKEADYIVPNNGTRTKLRDKISEIIAGQPTSTALNPFPHDDFDRVAQYL